MDTGNQGEGIKTCETGLKDSEQGASSAVTDTMMENTAAGGANEVTACAPLADGFEERLTRLEAYVFGGRTLADAEEQILFKEFDPNFLKKLSQTFSGTMNGIQIEKFVAQVVTAQASCVKMTSEEMVEMVHALREAFTSVFSGRKSAERLADGSDYFGESMNTGSTGNSAETSALASITNSDVICLVCGQRMKILNRKHLARHGLTPDAYRKEFGMPKDTALLCHDLKAKRQQNMETNRLWERRKGMKIGSEKQGEEPAPEVLSPVINFSLIENPVIAGEKDIPVGDNVNE